VSRFFRPRPACVDEEPGDRARRIATLIPYWQKRLGKTRLAARQLSRRGGALSLRPRRRPVTIAGRAAAYLEGTITV